MKPIYKSLLIDAEVLSVSLSLQAQVTSSEDVATQDVQAESLEGLKVVLISPNVSGAKDLIASGECVLDSANIVINLQDLVQGTHRVQVSAVFGTQTCVIYALDLTVPAGALSDTPQEFEDYITVVSTVGDGAGSQIVVDSELSDTSENPVQNKVIKSALAGKASQNDMTAAQDEISQLRTDVAGKASQNDMTAAQDEISQLRTDVNSIIDPKQSFVIVDGVVRTYPTELDNIIAINGYMPLYTYVESELVGGSLISRKVMNLHIQIQYILAGNRFSQILYYMAEGNTPTPVLKRVGNGQTWDSWTILAV